MFCLQVEDHEMFNNMAYDKHINKSKDPPRTHIQRKNAIIRTEIPPSLEWRDTRKQIGLKCQRYLRRIDGSNSKLCLSWELTLGRGFLFIQKSVEQKGAELFRNYDSECVQCVHASFHSTKLKNQGAKKNLQVN
ncbi:uncharacterized protein LOC110992208 [Pieris rapae]|uniref:uncharacterized protein LOC110992208 n=1 Tax=Pieris rapae TaxID=64459 RepID=UPI001E27C111|nr:uncharacterized protein LOC110992208 [Pieris rapae]